MAPFAIYENSNEPTSFTMCEDGERVHNYSMFRVLRILKPVMIEEITCQEAKRLQQSGVQEFVFDAVE